MDIIIGTTMVMGVSIAGLPQGMSMDDIDFECSFYCYPNLMQTISKDKMLRNSSDEYLAEIDTNLIGVGEMMMQIKVPIPDANCKDGYRGEVIISKTGYCIRKP